VKLGKVSYKEKERQRREEEILDKASQLLTERGYANLNMDELAEMVGISKPTLYQHFKSKEELVTKFLLQNMQTMQDKFEQWQEEKGDRTPLEAIKDMMRWLFHHRYKGGSIMSMTDQETMWSVMRNNPVMAESRKQAALKLFELIDKAKAAGEITATIPTPIIGRAFFCLQGALMNKDGQLTAQEKEFDEAVESVVNIFVHGVGSKSDGNE